MYVFDKQTGKAFITAIRNIAAERGFYDFVRSKPGYSKTLDDAMNEADRRASLIINDIRCLESVAGIVRKDFEFLCIFVALQWLRTRAFRELFLHAAQTFLEIMNEPGSAQPIDCDEVNDEGLRNTHMQLIPEFLQDSLPLLLQKDLVLFRCDGGTPYCISDNPVAFNNTTKPGSIGFVVQGGEIYLPISSALTLGFICPSIGNQYEELLKQPNLPQEWHDDSLCYLHGRDSGSALLLSPDDVRYLNALQALHAERFMMSSKNDFDDVQWMTAKYPETRFGPRAAADLIRRAVRKCEQL